MKKISCKKVSFKLITINGFAFLIADPSVHATLNDTGITWCANATKNNLACPVTNFPRQDGDFGRDVTNNDDSDGHAGFNFTKLDSQGKDLPNDATSWDCVRDNVTGMIWENKTSDGGLRDAKWTYTWYKSGDGTSSGGKCYQSRRCDTEKYVQDVNATGLCGFKDWRMPSPIELTGIVDYNIPYPGPTIDPDYFSNMKSVWFWASSPYVGNSKYAWYVYFSNGYVGYYGKYETNGVRLVRSGQYSLIFEDLNDGTVSQTNNGLMWAKCAEGLSGTDCKTGTAKSFTWQQALQVANKSRLAGYDDWRLPNVKELQSLVDYSTYSPAIDSTYFPNTPSGWFWASSPYAGNSSNAWYVYFLIGGVNGDGENDTSQVRLVRSGQHFLLFDLNVTKSGNGSGTVVSNPEGIECGSNCSTKFQQNVSVTLTATADSESTFGGWSGDCSGIDPCSMKMDTDKSVTAIFNKIPTYTLSINKSGNGTVTSTDGKINCGTDSGCSASYLQDTSVTLNAKPDDGYKFAGWSGSGCSGTGSCTVTLSANTSVTATFSSIETYYIAVNKTGSGKGTVTSNPAGIDCGTICFFANFTSGSTVTLTATPTADSRFANWGDACASFKNQPTCTLQVTKNLTVKAIFQPQPKVKLTLSFQGKGSVKRDPPGATCNASCQADYVRNTSVTLTATPSTDWDFAGWMGGGCVGTSTCTITMDQAREVTVVFKPTVKYWLKIIGVKTNTGTVTSGDNLISCQPTCVTHYAEGTEVTLTATPAEGYDEVVWGGVCEYSNGAPTCTFRMTQNQSVNARFPKIRKHNLTVHIKSGQGKVVSLAPDASISCRPSCVKLYDNNTPVVLQANPTAGFVFDHWDVSCSGSGICYVNMSIDRVVDAYFTRITP